MGFIVNRERFGKKEGRLAENRGNSEHSGSGGVKGKGDWQRMGDTVNRERWDKREGRLAENGGYSEQGEVGQRGREIGREWGIQ